MEEGQFYMDRHGNRMDLCKKCLTMHVDNFDENTYLWLLEKADVPYIPELWTSIRTKAYAKNPFGMTGMSVFGKYLAQMRLKQYHDYSYADSEKARADYRARHGDVGPQTVDPAFEQEMKEKLDAGEISQAQYQTVVSTETQHAEEPVYGAPPENFYNEQNYIREDELPDPSADLTDDDRTYLAMKWGRLYRPDEWVELEQKYNEMKESFDIQDADTEGTLLLICKTFLKMNQAVNQETSAALKPCEPYQGCALITC
ncbi:MAG: hypothetical protein LUC37_02800 [Prevotella sp.]|nr:hypothetical protein [Prevotella sp.]